MLEGFTTIGCVIALGAALAHLGVLDLTAQVVLSRLAFFVASPALMVTVLASTDVSEALSGTLVAAIASVVVAVLLYVLPARLLWRRDLGDTVVGALAASYVNAGNLGLPVAAYALGDVTLVAPVLLLQLLLLQPLALVLLDHAAPGARTSVRSVALRPLTNPLTVASVLGLVLSATGTTLPQLVDDPLHLVGGMAVPAMLLAYGVSLRLGPRPGHGTSATELGWIAVLKLVVQPLTASLVGQHVLGLEGHLLLAVTVIAALPTAQNVFVHASRYGRGVVVARDSIFLTTVLSIPAIVVVGAVLG